MKDHVIVGIHITDRAERAGEVQKVLTEHGANIRTRLGLHHVEEAVVGPQGLILLDVIGSETVIDTMCDKLRKLSGVQVQRMFFSHPK